MKINWGTSIAVVYGIFALVMIFALIKSTGHDHSLVVEDYYDQDLKYQQQFEKMQHSRDLQEPVEIRLNNVDRAVEIQFPVSMQGLSGEVLFYNPVDKKLDYKVSVLPDQTSHKQVIPIDRLRPGKWKVKIDWKAAGQAFYDEKELIL